MAIARNASKNSTCKKKHLGCVLELRSGRLIPGWNGPPLPLKPCESCRRTKKDWAGHADCRALHAERKVLLVTAIGSGCTHGAILYSAMGVPCKDCMLELIEAGIQEIVVERETYYDELSKEILQEWIASGGKFRVAVINDEETP